MKFAARALAAAAIMWVVLLIVLAITGCGQPKPPPVIPPGEAGCPEACRYVVTLDCGISERLCNDHCSTVARNNPKFPTCVLQQTACDFSGCQ
jgi:predicted small lipoprotein YifL